MDPIDGADLTDAQIDEILNNISQGGTGVLGEDIEANDEDTESTEESFFETDTNDQSDGDDQDTEEEDEDEDLENAPVDEDTEGKLDEDTDTEDEVAEPDLKTDGIDQEEYEKYKAFYEEIANAEFIANGKKVKGFTDPKKLIQSQQMAYGYSEKMAGFKQYRPFLGALKDRGILEDESKFNLAMNLLDGDTDALKQHIKTLGIDPLDLDMDQINYTGKSHVASNPSLILEDTLETAKQYGVEDKLRSVLGKEWDNESFQEFVDVPETRRDLLDHMASGAFDVVQDKIREMKTFDMDGTFSQMKSTDQYRAAVKLLTAEAQRNGQGQDDLRNRGSRELDQSKVEAEKQRILEAKQQEDYKRKLEEKAKVDNANRTKAASVTKKRTTVTTTKKFDPMALEGAELDEYVQSLINGGR